MLLIVAEHKSHQAHMQRQHHDWDGAKFQEVVGQPAEPTPHGALDQNCEDETIQHLASAIMPTVLFLRSHLFSYLCTKHVGRLSGTKSLHTCIP